VPAFITTPTTKGRPECLVGNNADYEFEIVDVDELGDDAVYCDHCAGEVVQESNVGSARASQLAKMSPEQLGLSPMGDRP